MTDARELKIAIMDSGVTITFIADKMGCSRNRIYSIMKGADCTASEIVKFCEILHLTKNDRDRIFLSEKVN